MVKSNHDFWLLNSLLLRPNLDIPNYKWLQVIQVCNRIPFNNISFANYKCTCLQNKHSQTCAIGNLESLPFSVHTTFSMMFWKTLIFNYSLWYSDMFFLSFSCCIILNLMLLWVTQQRQASSFAQALVRLLI